MNSLVLEDVTTLEQWERVVAIRNADTPDGPQLVDRVMNYAAVHPKHVPIRRVILSEGGRDLAHVMIEQAFWFPKPELYAASVYLNDPSGAAQAVEFAESQTKEFGGTDLMIWYRTDRPVLGEALAAAGYTFGQRNPVVMLDLTEFDPAPWLPFRQKAEASGYEMMTVEAFGKRNPETWMKELWQLEMEIFRDVPLPEPFQPIPFDEWEKEIGANPLRFDWMFFAVWDNKPVAMAQLFPNHVDKTLSHTGLTGTSREHRRKGLASALKGMALSTAKSGGITRIYTDNEENNPMRQLNLAMGFKTVYEQVEGRKSLA